MSSYGLDEIQLRIIRKKFSQFFKRVSDVYKCPSATEELVNNGISFKIASCYSPNKGFFLSERADIVKKLSDIKFTIFFTSPKGYTINDKKTFFNFKTPQNFLESSSSNADNFIKYSIKKYCSSLSSEKLTEIYHKTIPQKATKTQNELKQAIYDIASIRGTFTNRLASIFENSENKKEIKVAAELTKTILNSNHIIISENTKNNSDIDELKLLKSVCKKYE
jgi:hypothetical protein